MCVHACVLNICTRQCGHALIHLSLHTCCHTQFRYVHRQIYVYMHNFCLHMYTLSCMCIHICLHFFLNSSFLFKMEFVDENLYSCGRRKTANFLNRLLHEFLGFAGNLILTVFVCTVTMIYFSRNYMPKLFKIEMSLENTFRILLCWILSALLAVNHLSHVLWNLLCLCLQDNTSTHN